MDSVRPDIVGRTLPAYAATSDIPAALARIWDRAQPTLLARVTAIDQAIAELRKKRATKAQIEAGHSEAHRLAGVLGTFGLERGTELARELEQKLSEPDAKEAVDLQRLAAALRQLVECADSGHHATDTPTVGAPPRRRGR
jgi:HPt (histidine-containing phosphotransfer) domain-containing protein